MASLGSLEARASQAPLNKQRLRSSLSLIHSLCYGLFGFDLTSACHSEVNPYNKIRLPLVGSHGWGFFFQLRL